MKASEIINKTGLLLVRNRGEHTKSTDWEYDVKEAFTGNKRNWIYLDNFTLSAMRTVYNALSDISKSNDFKLR